MVGPVDVLGITQVYRLQRSGQRNRAAGNNYQVKMITHQAIRQNLQTVLIGILLQELQITSPVVVGEEYILTTITALRNMMWNSGNYRSKPFLACSDCSRIDWLVKGKYG